MDAHEHPREAHRGPSPPAGVAPEIGSLFPPASGVLWLRGSIAELQGRLGPGEAAQVRGVAEVRRREYTAGRTLARDLLGRLGHTGWELLADGERCPQWPPGVAGSISHTRSECFVAVAPAAAVGSVGLDVEQPERLGSKLWRLIFTAAEQRALSGIRDESRRRRAATARFCVKEAFFKFQFPLTRAMLGFLDAEVEVEPAAAGPFSLRLLRDVDPARGFGCDATFSGRFSAGRSLVGAGIVGPEDRRRPVPGAAPRF